MTRLLLAIAIGLPLFFLTACASPRPLPTGEARLLAPEDDPAAAEFNKLFRQDDVYFAGYPTEAGLRAMADRGVKQVVSLKTPEQVTKARGIDEDAIAKELGLNLVWLPISPDSFSDADVARFAKLYEGSSGPLLIHCGSSNTVGGLWAEYLHQRHGVPLDDAIEQGRAVGLRADSMVDAVRRVAE